MTRALGLRSSTRKPSKSNQNEVPEDCKENSPSILSQNSRKALLANKTSKGNKNPKALVTKRHDSSKENRPPVKCVVSNSTASLPVNAGKECAISPVRKSVRRFTPSDSEQAKPKLTQLGRNVLSDRTNSPRIRPIESEEQSIDLLKTIENKNKISHKLVSVPKPSTSKEKGNKENHIPVYKTISPFKTMCKPTLANEKEEAVYDFEVDENEEPAQKKKRKKRIYVRKPKLGPKALTINNIKYSSTESLASLPEKPTRQKKKPKMTSNLDLKSHSLATTFNNNSNYTTNSVVSFMSHPASLTSRHHQKLVQHHNLSVLQESQSEQCTSIHSETNELPEPIVQETNIGCSSTTDSKTNCLSNSQSSHFSPNPRCYSSKSGRTPNPYSDQLITSYQNMASSSVSHKGSPYSTNQSTHFPVFLSSTPCKRSSLVVCHNSVFDESDDIPLGVRPSTGFIRNASASAPIDDKFFGFDEPEELEEPLVSPIKSSIDLEPPRKPVRKMPLNFDLRLEQDAQPKPSVQEVMNMLKATLPKTAAKKETTEVFDTSSESSVPNSPTIVDKDTPVFTKPARRSYERPRKVHYDFSEAEEESEHENEEQPVHKKVPKEVKKFYKKKSDSSKISKAPKVTKAQQRMAKEEEELERLAAQMNAQFQQIEKTNLVVE